MGRDLDWLFSHFDRANAASAAFAAGLAARRGVDMSGADGTEVPRVAAASGVVSAGPLACPDPSGVGGVDVAVGASSSVSLPVGEDVWVRVWRALDALGAVLGELFDQEEGDPAPKGVHLIRAGQRIDLDLIYVGEEDGQHVFEAVGVPPLPTDRFCVDTLPPKTTVRYCLDPKLIPVPKELPDA